MLDKGDRKINLAFGLLLVFCKTCEIYKVWFISHQLVLY
jgi:hypothetical protein